MSEAPRPRSRDCQSGWIHRSSEERTWCSDIMAWTTTCIRPVHRMGYFWPRGEKKFARTICVVQRGTSPAEIDSRPLDDVAMNSWQFDAWWSRHGIASDNKCALSNK